LFVAAIAAEIARETVIAVCSTFTAEPQRNAEIRRVDPQIGALPSDDCVKRREYQQIRDRDNAQHDERDHQVYEVSLKRNPIIARVPVFIDQESNPEAQHEHSPVPDRFCPRIDSQPIQQERQNQADDD
jgi:hypothetical protein